MGNDAAGDCRCKEIRVRGCHPGVDQPLPRVYEVGGHDRPAVVVMAVRPQVERVRESVRAHLVGLRGSALHVRQLGVGPQQGFGIKPADRLFGRYVLQCGIERAGRLGKRYP